MRIFQGFLIVFITVVLLMLPVTRAIYNYRTDVREDLFNYETIGAEVTANVTLHSPVYDNDTNTISILSDLATDIPLFSAYNTTTRLLDITGMTLTSNRTLRVCYDINALIDHDSLDAFIGWLPLIWILMVCVMPVAGIYAIIKRRT